MAMRKREEEILLNTAGIDVGASSHWVAVPGHALRLPGVPAMRRVSDEIPASTLVQMNIQLTEVLSDVMATTGQTIIRDTVAGERDPAVLVRHHSARLQASAQNVRRALTDDWRDEHLFLLEQSLAIFDDLARRVQEYDARMEALLAPLQRHTVRLEASAKGRGTNNPTFDVRQVMASRAGVDLTRIDGPGVSIVMELLSEIGTDLGRFASVKPFCSWLGLCPGTKISSGKVLSAGTGRSVNRVRQALQPVARSLSRNGPALGAFYRRPCSRMDKPRANTAVAHKLARMVYFVLARGEDYVDQGREPYEQQQRQHSIALERCAAALGGHITPDAATT